jgi:hypothetical protein
MAVITATTVVVVFESDAGGCRRTHAVQVLIGCSIK